MADIQDTVLGEVQVQGTRPTFTQIDGPFGKERVPVQDLNVTDAVAPPVTPDGPAIPLTNETVQGDLGFNTATAARADRAGFLDSTVLEGVGAAIMSWDTTRLVKRLARPTFANEEPISQFEYLENTPLNLEADEREYFMDVAKGKDSAAYAIRQIEDRRLARRVVGDHEITGMATAFIDPLWLAIPPALRIGRVAGVAGRVVAGASGAGIAGAITAGGEGPVSDEELALSMIMNGAVSTALFKPGKGLVPKDPEFPAAQLDASVAKAQGDLAATVNPSESVAVFDATLPPALQRGALNTDAAVVADSVESAIQADAKVRGVGERLQWNMRKTMAGYGPVGKKVADLLFDNNSDFTLKSMESEREAIVNNLRTYQYQYEDLLRQSMAEDGAGLLQMVMPWTARKVYATQLGLEKQVQRELFRREQYSRQGLDITADAPEPRITKMADALDRMHQVALKEMQAAGVEGAENLLERPGYLNRKWSSSAIDNAISKLEAQGLKREAAHAKLTGLVGLAIRRANGMEKDLANQIGQAIVDRALRKGYFEDALFNAPAGEGQMKQLRDILKAEGMPHANIERALEVLRVSSDDAGKAGFMKHRMDLDYKATVRVGNEQVSVMDLIDPNVTSIVDQYTRQVATTSAFARKGLKKRSDVEALRTELSHSIQDEAMRKEAIDLFDNVMNHMRGLPAGAAMNEHFRLMQQYGRTITLAWSGLWQMTEYATQWGRYGLLKSLKYSMQELPGFKQLMGSGKQEAGMLNTVLADHSSQSLRLRPYLSRFEDGYEMNMSNAASLSAQTWGDLVPMANAMKYVHKHQARVVGNLILDRLDQASKGNKAAREALAGYGLEAPVMDRVAAQIKQHGFKVDNWDDKVWAEVRPSLGKMMDESVLRERLGDMPAFAKFDQVGKFVFTYRSFVLTAHNKVLAGMAERNGAGAVGLILMYQLPLSLLAVQAQNSIKGEKVSQDKLIAQALGQLGGLGLFSEPLRWATGQSNSIGAPALIPMDRGIKLLQNGLSGEGDKAASTAMTMLPVLSAIPFVRGMANQIKE